MNDLDMQSVKERTRSHDFVVSEALLEPSAPLYLRKATEPRPV